MVPLKNHLHLPSSSMVLHRQLLLVLILFLRLSSLVPSANSQFVLFPRGGLLPGLNPVNVLADGGSGLGRNDKPNDQATRGEAVSGEDLGEKGFDGVWELASENSGVSAMHMQLLPSNKALIFDSTAFGPSKIGLSTKRQCPIRPKSKGPDCWAHAVIYDIETAELRPLDIITDPWCSSGGLGSDGTFVSTGGWGTGAKSVRILGGCNTCDWKDSPDVLGNARWYSTQTKLADGAFVVMGGRRSYSYEFVTVDSKISAKTTFFPFLDETTDLDENNLYPFVKLLPDGNLFVFANSRSVLLDPRNNRIIREYPRLAGGSRNYPASGMSTLLPMKLDNHQSPMDVKAEIIVCGGAKAKAYRAVEKNETFMPALQDCARMVVTDPNPQWKRERMPSRRVMGDMLILPTGDLLMLNGAHKGTSAWNFAEDPNYVPVLYKPDKPVGQRFRALEAATIPRMYHSTSMVLPDGKILVGGSNTNPTYLFTNVKYPTEMRMEKYTPPYLDPALQQYRPEITGLTNKKMKYDKSFYIKFKLQSDSEVSSEDLKVTMYSPPFTTHGYSMNQRLLQLALTDLRSDASVHNVTAKTPLSGTLAPPGYYLMFVVYKGVPSVGEWVRIGN